MSQKNIVLIHGWGAETSKLEPLKKELSKLGWNVYIPKLLGFEKPAPKEVWGITEYSKYIYDEAQEKFNKSKFYVFGHSFGGGVAIKIGAIHKSHIKGVILCATRGISRPRSIKRIVFGTIAKAGKVLLITPSIADGFRKLLYRAAREHDYEKTKGIMRDIFKKIISEDLKPYLNKIKPPVLIFWGEQDRMTPLNDALVINRTIKTSRLITFKNEGHRLPYEKPKLLAKEINIWAK